MRIIFNSDVLHGDYSRHGLPESFRRFAAACADLGHVLVVPSTTLLEVQRIQQRMVSDRRAQVKSALRTLTEVGVELPEVDLDKVVEDVDINILLSDLAADVEIVNPTLEDFEDAHRRACLHESPQQPDSKSDEMRDLIIWAVALKVAAADGGALLVSRDVVHSHNRGDSEASDANLARVSSMEQALDYLDVRTVAGEQLEAMLAAFWSPLAAEGVPVGRAPMLLSAKGVQFIQGPGRPVSAEGSIRVHGEGGGVVSGKLVIDNSGNGFARLTFSDIEFNDESLADVEVRAEVEELSDGGESERLAALREMMEG